MGNIDELLEYGNESLNLDFKGAQYKKEKHEEFIKDIVSMANADTNDERYIIIGVKYTSEMEKELQGIDKKDFIDDAVYQQIIRENVEPDINFEYLLYEYENKFFGVFRIENCTDKPYLMKKEYKRLEKGDSWIRKGTHQPRMIRRDFDNIYEQKMALIGFNGPVDIFFEENMLDDIIIHTAGDIILPSEQNAKSIRQAIAQKKNPIAEKQTLSGLDRISDIALYGNFGIKPYSVRTLEELEENLNDVKKDFAEDDAYFLFEEKGYRLNLFIENRGEEYIEDGQIHVYVPKVDGLRVASRVTEKPERDSFRISAPVIYSTDGPRYPIITESDKYIVIKRYFKNIKHHIPIPAFEIPVRIFFSNKLDNTPIELKCEIFGKNLKKPLSKLLKIHLRAPDTNS